MAQKRTLKIDSLDDALSDIERLIANGYQSAGKWNLAQSCNHLNHWIRFPVHGFPKLGIFMGSVMWLMKITVAQRQLKSILENGFTDGVPTLGFTISSASSEEDAKSFDELKQSVAEFVNFKGNYFPSPLFGNMDKDKWHRLQLRHFEHHLSFLIPSDGDSTGHMKS